MMIGTATPNVTLPVAESACNIPTDALELWMIAVRRRPVRIPMKGLLKEVKKLWNFSDSLRGSKVASIRVIP